MAYEYFKYDRKADILWHLKRGPVIIPRNDLQLLAEHGMLSRRYKISQAGRSLKKVRVELA